MKELIETLINNEAKYKYLVSVLKEIDSGNTTNAKRAKDILLEFQLEFLEARDQIDRKVEK